MSEVKVKCDYEGCSWEKEYPSQRGAGAKALHMLHCKHKPKQSDETETLEDGFRFLDPKDEGEKKLIEMGYELIKEVGENPEDWEVK